MDTKDSPCICGSILSGILMSFDNPCSLDEQIFVYDFRSVAPLGLIHTLTKISSTTFREPLGLDALQDAVKITIEDLYG